MSQYAISANLGYRWVMLTKLANLDSPGFWKLADISDTPEDGGRTRNGLRLVREIEGHYIMLECYPDTEQGRWKFRGWVLEGLSHVYDYKQIELACEVVAVSEPHILSSYYDIVISKTGGFEFSLDSSATESTANSEYLFSSLLESHSRATYFKYLNGSLHAEESEFSVARIRQGERELEAFGKTPAGEWSILLTENVSNNLYNVVFTLWRKGESSKEIKNNPDIVSQESRYYSSASRADEPIFHLSKVLSEAIKVY